MGRQDVSTERDSGAIRAFTKAILHDLSALEAMLERGMIETGIRRFGVEQEFFLVDQGWRPAKVAVKVLERLPEGGPFTTELALFNLEANLEPKLLTGRCFSALQVELEELIETARAAARQEGAEVVLAGILPTLGKSDLSLDNITPMPRYYALNDALNRMRGGAYRLRIEGTDEILIEHDSVMLEACNTSCQVHLQVSAEEFAHFYNVAQVVTAPVLAASVNSPILFGKRLWYETRIALFQQSMDTRSATPHLREMSPRVRFGERWVDRSVVELFEEDIARFRVLLAGEVEEDPFEVLEKGGVPHLKALQTHNGTVYRWNRPCYGISEGKPHLRIECRALPSGPTPVDEVANAAFWIGLVIAGAREFGSIPEQMDFADAKANFLAASRRGLEAAFHWIDGETIGARELILDRLIPLAASGLEELGIEDGEVEHYLKVVRERVETGITGAVWQLKSLFAMKDEGTRAERLTALTSAIARRQRDGRPGHVWEPAELWEAGGWRHNFLTVEQYMVTDLFTVHEDEPIELVAFLMDKQNIRHVLVEDDAHRLVGLVSYRSILRLVANSGTPAASETAPVRTVMETNPVSVTPETPTLEAIEIMRERKVAALPVEKNEKLVGIVTERDFLPIAYELLEERLREA